MSNSAFFLVQTMTPKSPFEINWPSGKLKLTCLEPILTKTIALWKKQIWNFLLFFESNSSLWKNYQSFRDTIQIGPKLIALWKYRFGVSSFGLTTTFLEKFKMVRCNMNFLQPSGKLNVVWVKTTEEPDESLPLIS